MSATLLSRRRLLLAAAFVALCAAAFLLVVALSSPQPAIVNGPRLVNALAQYARDLRSRGVPIPPTVTLDALLHSGYVTPEDVKPFQGARLTFHADAQDTNPQDILVEADMPGLWRLPGMFPCKREIWRFAGKIFFGPFGPVWCRLVPFGPVFGEGDRE